MSVELTVPEVGESITEVQIGRWLKSDGDSVGKDEDIVELETEKASVTVPAPEAGTLKITVEEGEFADVGDVIAKIEPSEEAAGEEEEEEEAEAEAEAEADQEEAAEGEKEEEPEEAEEGAEEAEEDEAEEEETEPDQKEAAAEAEEETEETEEAEEEEVVIEGGHKLMPAAARMVQEHDLDPADIDPTGPDGRILKEDVQRYLKQSEAKEAAKAALSEEAEEKEAADEAGPEAEEEAVAEPTEPEGPAAPPSSRTEDVRPMSMIRRTIARRLVQAQQEAALLTTFNEIDMQPVKDLRARFKERFQEEHGVKLGFMSFFAKASVAALKRFPAVNSEIRDDEVVTKSYYDIGIAIGGGRGLIVPVIRDVDRLSFAEIERKIADLGERAQSDDIDPDELEGGTFTISNGGIYGSLLSTPIVNPPQSGILGMHAIQDRPVVRDGEIVVRPMMYVALTYDHRIVDGREAVSFLKTIKEVVEEPERLFLEV